MVRPNIYTAGDGVSYEIGLGHLCAGRNAEAARDEAIQQVSRKTHDPTPQVLFVLGLSDQSIAENSHIWLFDPEWSIDECYVVNFRFGS